MTRIDQKTRRPRTLDQRRADALARKVEKVADRCHSVEWDEKLPQLGDVWRQNRVPRDRIIEAFHRRAEEMLERGAIDVKGAQTLVGLIRAGAIGSAETYDLLENLMERGGEGSGRLESFLEYRDHFANRARGCSIVDLRAAQDIRSIALRDGKLTHGETRQLAELLLRYEFSPAGRKVIDDLLADVPVGLLYGGAKDNVIGSVLAAWKEKRPKPLVLTSEELERIRTVIDIGGFTAKDRTELAKNFYLKDLAPESRAAFEALLARPAIGDHAPWTFFVHMNACPNLEYFAAYNMKELEKVGSTPGTVNVLALIDGDGEAETSREKIHGWKGGTRLMWISKSPDGRFKSHPLPLTPELEALAANKRGRVDMADPRVLRAGVEAARKLAPSDHLMVQLWGHGLPWKGHRDDRRGVRSESSGSIMNPSELEAALKDQKIDVLSCISCSMASREIALAAERAGVPMLVASEAPMPGVGTDYAGFLGAATAAIERNGAMTPSDLSKLIADTYAEMKGRGSDDTETISVMDLKHVPAVWKALDALTDTLLAMGGLDKNDTIRACWMSAREVSKDQIDLGAFARSLASRFKNRPAGDRAKELLLAIKSACYSRASSEPERGEWSREEGRKARLDKRGQWYRNQWRKPREDLPTGISIYAPKREVDKEYGRDGSPWAGTTWSKLLDGLEARPISREERRAAEDAREAKESAHLAKRRARAGIAETAR